MNDAILDYKVIYDLFSKNACDLFIKKKNSVVFEYHPFRILNGERDDILVKIDQIFKISSAPEIFVKFKDNLQISGYSGGYGFGIDIYGEMISIGADNSFKFTREHEDWESQFPNEFDNWEDEDFNRLKDLTGW